MNDFVSFYLMLHREILLSYRKRAEMAYPLFFFVMVSIIFPLASTPDPKILQLLGPGILWVAALLAVLLSINKLFKEDYQDGCLEQMLLSPQPLSLLVFAKIIAHWLMFGLPLILISPLLAVMFHLSMQTIAILMLTLLLGTPILNFIGAIGAALTVSLKNSGLLLALILLPLYIPPLIFGTSAILSAENGVAASFQLLILSAFLVLVMTLVPVTVAFVLRMQQAFQ